MASEHVQVIVGAAGGIGTEVTRLARDRCVSLVLAGRNTGPLEKLADDLGVRHPLILECDATDPSSVEDLEFESSRRFGRVDSVVNLAGSIVIKPAHATTPDEFERTFRTNTLSAFNIVRSFAPSMRRPRQRGGGSIVLMSSCAASVGLPAHEAIAAAKAGVEGLARSAAATYASTSVRVNAVAPGLVDTPLASPITSSEPALKASVNMHPLGRIGQPSDVASVIDWLLSPESAWVTGQVIGVDGGLARVRGRSSP